MSMGHDGTVNAVKEDTVKSSAEDLRGRLSILLADVNNLVRRTPAPTCGIEPENAFENVFDEILQTLTQCKTLTSDISERVREGISNKVL